MEKKFVMKIVVTTEGNTFTPSKDSIVKEYEIVNDGSKEAIKYDYQESRQVWSEYYVIADCETYMLSESHTFRDQFLNEEIQWEYMNGAYED